MQTIVSHSIHRLYFIEHLGVCGLSSDDVYVYFAMMLL